MRITSHSIQEQTIRTTHAMRMQVRKGLIINIFVQTLNGEMFAWYGQRKRDQHIIWKMPEARRADIKAYLQEQAIAERYYQ